MRKKHSVLVLEGLNDGSQAIHGLECPTIKSVPTGRIVVRMRSRQ
jgi:hypothetical protein